MPLDVVLAIDPGRSKCGIAAASLSGVILHEVCPVEQLVVRVRALLRSSGAARIVIGSGTNGAKLARALRDQPDFPDVKMIEEAFTTIEAKKRFFEENPPKGFKRLIPRGLLQPGCPIDDYAAIILAERALNHQEVV